MKKNKPFRELFCSSLKKTLLTMRIAIILMILGILQARANDAYSQKTRLSIDFSETELVKVLDKIEDESEFFFLYNEKLLDTDRKVSINEQDQLISVILDELFTGTDVKYSIIDRKIILAPEFLTNASEQQLRSITGTVTDANGNAIPGVTVKVQGTTLGTLTDASGKYSIDNVLQNATLSFSFVGMATQEIPSNGQKMIDVVLTELAIGLDEIVVIGYGTQRKANISGAITSVGTKELHSLATNDAGQALQGKAPVYATRNSGTPGEVTSIFLRGVGTMRDASPLWIIDGIQSAPLDNFNDVESIQILKDAASTAIYGVHGANGVILVTTKKAHKGSISVDYNGYVKSSNALGLPKFLNTQQYIDVYKDRWLSNNPTLTEADMPSYIKSFYFSTPAEVSQLPSTDWGDVMFKTGIAQVHTLSVSGGSDKSTYRISLVHENDEGTYESTNFTKTAAKLDFTQQAAKWLKLSETVNYSYSKSIPFWGAALKTNTSLFTNVFRGNPAMEVYDSSNPMGTGFGYFTPDFAQTIDWQGTNPLEEVKMKDYWTKSENLFGSLQAVVTPTKGLVWTTNISGRMNNNWLSYFNYNLYGGVAINSLDFINSFPGKYNQFYYDQSGSRQYLLNSFANYDKTIGKSQFGIMLGLEVIQSEFHGATGYATYGIPSEVFRTTQLTTNRDGYNLYGDDSGYSQFGRLTYAFDNRYLMTATFRNDASSKFAPGKRQAFFPAISLGWNIANESFFNIDQINELKLRVGIGKSGNDDVPANLWRQEYSALANGAWAAQKVVNEDITWETTLSNNIGLDLGLLNNSLTATIDFYNKETQDALLYLAIPSTTGFSNYYVNKGTIQNRGLELTLGYAKSINDFNFSVNGNVGYNENKVLDIGEAAYLSGGIYNRTYADGPVSAFFGFVADGLYKSQTEIDELNANAQTKGFASYDGSVGPGDIKFKDLNGDGTITSDKDQTSIGNPWPKFVYGLNFNFEYKGFDLAMNWQGVAGIDIYNGLLAVTENMAADYNTTPDALNAWSSSNPNSSIPRLGNSAHNFDQSSSYSIQDGSYLRLKNIQVGYNFKQGVLSKVRIQNLRIYMGMENALTFTKFTGFDPEFMSGTNYQRGVYGMEQYPQARSIIFGVQIGIN
jgi:TonB-dependent starch-binding outer membrane protein SusC